MQLPDDADQRYFSPSPAQKAFNASAQGKAQHSRGGENVGGGFWRYAPTHFVQLGGAADTVGVEPLVACEPQRTYGCERGVCPVHKWNGVHALGTAGLARTYESSHTRARGAPARAILCIRVLVIFVISTPRRESSTYQALPAQSGPWRISGVYHDDWYCSHWVRCGLCQKEREDLKERLKQLQDSRVLHLAMKKRRVAELQNDVNKAQFWCLT